MEMEEEIHNSYLTFIVNDSIYGVHVSKVVEIMAYTQPQAKTMSGMNYMLGLIEHRDGVVPLIDTGLKFGSHSISINEQTYVVVLGIEKDGKKFDVAMAVDSVREVILVPEEQHKAIASSYKPGYVVFAGPTPDGLGLFFNPDLVFSDTDIIEMSRLIGETK